MRIWEPKLRKIAFAVGPHWGSLQFYHKSPWKKKRWKKEEKNGTKKGGGLGVSQRQIFDYIYPCI